MAVKSRPLTPAQRALFWRAFSAACLNLGIGTADREEYRHRVLREAAGCGHLAEVDRTGDFDKVMYRLSFDTNDLDGMVKYAVGDERRIGYLIKVSSIQIMQIKGDDESMARRYLSGLLDQSKISNGVNLPDDSFWMDLSFRDGLSTFKMLDTHRRRMLRNHNTISTFSPAHRYVVSNDDISLESVKPGYYDAIPFKVNIIK